MGQRRWREKKRERKRIAGRGGKEKGEGLPAILVVAGGGVGCLGQGGCFSARGEGVRERG